MIGNGELEQSQRSIYLKKESFRRLGSGKSSELHLKSPLMLIFTELFSIVGDAPFFAYICFQLFLARHEKQITSQVVVISI